MFRLHLARHTLELKLALERRCWGLLCVKLALEWRV